jgi:thiamine kinase-like enzyme
MGATQIGSFHSSEFNTCYAAMRMDFASTYNEHVIDGPRMFGRKDPQLVPLSIASLQQYADRQNAGIRIDTWKPQQLASGGPDVAGVWRIAAAGRDINGEPAAWSCIAKALRHAGQPASAQSGCAYDEVMGYRNGHPPPAATHLKMPRLLDVVQGDQTQTMILEDVYDSSTRALRLSDVQDLAERLGTWHALGTHSKNDRRGNWLREYVRQAEPLVAALPAYGRQTDMLDDLLAAPAAGLISEIWAHRRMLLATLDSLPQACCHQDVTAGNVAVRERGAARTYYLLDWATAGMAPLGAELAPLIVGSAILMHWDIESGKAVLRGALDAYRQGLLSNDVKIDADTIELAFMASAALRYIAWGGHRVDSVLDPAKQEMARKVTGHPLPEMIANYCTVRRQLAVWGAAAVAAASPADLALVG